MCRFLGSSRSRSHGDKRLLGRKCFSRPVGFLTSGGMDWRQTTPALLLKSKVDIRDSTFKVGVAPVRSEKIRGRVSRPSMERALTQMLLGSFERCAGFTHQKDGAVGKRRAARYPNSSAATSDYSVTNWAVCGVWEGRDATCGGAMRTKTSLRYKLAIRRPFTLNFPLLRPFRCEYFDFPLLRHVAI